MLNKKAEADQAENLFYVFVRLNSTAEPAFHIAPRADVAQFVRSDHATWLRTLGKGGRAHVDNPVRKFKDPSDQYLGRWDLLGLGPSEAYAPNLAPRSPEAMQPVWR
jgi:hypothetical protein